MNDSTELIRKKKEELEGVQDIQSKLKEKAAHLIQEIEEIEESGWCFGVRIYQNDEEYEDFQCKSSKAARCLYELIRDISDGRSLKVTQYRAERSLIKKPIDFCEAPEPMPKKDNEDNQEDPFSELIESLERLKNGILENDRQDRIELLKLAVQMATQYSKKESGMKFGFATETFYKQLCKLAGLNEPQPQTVEQALQNLETLMAEPPDTPQADIQDPRKVLAENGYQNNNSSLLEEHRKGGLCVFWNGHNWGTYEAYRGTNLPKFWDGHEPFSEWLAAREKAQIPAETAKPEQPAAEQDKPEPNAIYNNAAKAENAKEARMEPVNFLRLVVPYLDQSGKLDGDMLYFSWRGQHYRYHQASNTIDFVPRHGIISSNDASILMTALVKLAAKA